MRRLMPTAKTTLHPAHEPARKCLRCRPRLDDPSDAAHVRNALVFGMRLVLTAGYPKKAPATEATDPTVPPEGPAPTDDNGSGSGGKAGSDG